MLSSESYIASLDVGTTTIRCQIINSLTKIVGSSRCAVKLIYPKPGFFEINPNELWEQIIKVINEAISDANLTPQDIKCLGISTQRSTFITWHRETGKTFHNFITWKDIRVKDLCKEINSSVLIKTLRSVAFSLYLVTRSDRFLLGSRLKISSEHVTGRLLWVLRHVPELKEALNENNLMFGTLDTWLIYKLTNQKLHVTDISNAAATGFFDPFVLEWSSWSKYFLGIPHQILPEVVANDFDFGETSSDIFGAAIPIKCVMGDSSSAMFASCCFDSDDVKVTLGTGAFLDVNTAKDIHTGVTGIYPLVGWTIKKQTIYLGEVACNDCGSLIQWLLNVGWIKNPSELTEIVTSVKDSDGVYFIPAFSGLGPPINDVKAGSGFLGIKPTTTRNHLIRAVLEGLVYRLALIFRTLKKERNRNYPKITTDGGVSKNDFICQMLADLTGIIVERLECTEMSSLGVAFVAGISSGIWNSIEQVRAFKNIDKSFKPNPDEVYRKKCFVGFEKWLAAMERFKLWYDED